MPEETRGLGKIVYSNDPDDQIEERKDTTSPTDQVRHASEESFPASDPPSYVTGSTGEPTASPETSNAADHPPATVAATEMAEHDRERDKE